MDKIEAAGRSIGKAEESDKEELLNLYQSMIGGPADWNEYYPSMETIEFDIAHDSLFVLKNEKKEIIKKYGRGIINLIFAVGVSFILSARSLYFSTGLFGI